MDVHHCRLDLSKDYAFVIFINVISIKNFVHSFLKVLLLYIESVVSEGEHLSVFADFQSHDLSRVLSFSQDVVKGGHNLRCGLSDQLLKVILRKECSCQAELTAQACNLEDHVSTLYVFGVQRAIDQRITLRWCDRLLFGRCMFAKLHNSS